MEHLLKNARCHEYPNALVWVDLLDEENGDYKQLARFVISENKFIQYCECEQPLVDKIKADVEAKRKEVIEKAKKMIKDCDLYGYPYERKHEAMHLINLYTKGE